jgi:hypothetical protein
MLESSFVFEGKKAGEDCSASPGLSKARYHLDLLMKNHFGGRKNGSVSLTTPGKEGKEEEAAYKGMRKELNDKKNFYEDKLRAIEGGKISLGEVYCSREGGLVCLEGKWKCVECGDEDVKKNAELREVCGLKEEEGGWNGKGEKKGGGSSGVQGGQQKSEFIAAVGSGNPRLNNFSEFPLVSVR